MEDVMEMVHSPSMGEIFGKISGFFRESPEGVKRGFESAVPLSMVGLAERASTQEGAQELLSTLEGGQYPHLDASELGRVTADPDSAARVARSSEGFLSRLFGNKQRAVVDELASNAGVTTSSASKLLGLALPMVLGFVGKQTASRHLDASGLRGFLASQRKLAGDALPGPLSHLIGDDARPRAIATERPVAYPHAVPRERPRIGKWLLLPLAAVVVLVLLVSRRGGRHEAPLVESTPQTHLLTGPAAAQTVHAGDLTALSRALAGEESLPRRFVLSDLTFSVASSEIDPAGTPVLDQLAQLLAAHPGARIRIEGHTDNIGGRGANEKLSRARAESTRTYLVGKGIAGDRIEATGYGQDRPLASNELASGRADNRRTEVVVLAP